MTPPLLHTWKEQRLWLTAARCIYWEEERTLIASDLHLGKTGHFRKAGIAVPQSVYKEDLQRLLQLIGHFRAERLLVVGDFFHSRENAELNLFSRWRSDVAHVRFTLVRGNHDILKGSWYADNDIEVVEGSLSMPPFSFVHEPGAAGDGTYAFCGHLHPGIFLRGGGKQSLSLPCYYFGKEFCILPAFSRFTGLALIRPERGDRIFAIADNNLIAL